MTTVVPPCNLDMRRRTDPRSPLRPARRLVFATALAALLVGALVALPAGRSPAVDDATIERLAILVTGFAKENGTQHPTAWAVKRTRGACTLPFDGACALPGRGPVAYVVEVRGTFRCRTCHAINGFARRAQLSRFHRRATLVVDPRLRAAPYTIGGPAIDLAQFGEPFQLLPR